MRTGGTWRVEYASGEVLDQYDTNHPACNVAAGEVPYRAIQWPEVRKLVLTSQYAEDTFDVAALPEGFQLSLRSRHFMSTADEMLWCYLLVVSRASEEVTDQSTVSVLYWFPDGSTHECPHFNCPDVASYGHNWIHDQDRRLPLQHNIVQTTVDATLV